MQLKQRRADESRRNLAQRRAEPAGRSMSTPGEVMSLLGFTPDVPTPGSAKRADGLEFRRARQTIYRRGEHCDAIILICEGWAFRLRQLSDGRRQILGFLLPGDLIGPGGLCRNQLDFSVQALTDVRFRRLDRRALRAQLTQPEPLTALLHLMTARHVEADSQLVDLGQRHADERIAGLILRLRERLVMRGDEATTSFAFPLRQQHIADATGLTSVHVSRVLTGLRRAGILTIADGRIVIHDLEALARIGVID